MSEDKFKKIIDEEGDTVISNTILTDDEELTFVKKGTSRYYCGTCAKSFENLQKLNEHNHECGEIEFQWAQN